MPESQESRRYRVQLGHADVHVEGDTPELALDEARRRLSLEYPRLWNVIHEAEDAQFRVDRAA